ncbi:MAG TPA: hypothetical protein VLX92_21515 [Kofleriaceae bacterium]|nr:hypothetical protein [Kofleriaceae bacterium]
MKWVLGLAGIAVVALAIGLFVMTHRGAPRVEPELARTEPTPPASVAPSHPALAPPAPAAASDDDEPTVTPEVARTEREQLLGHTRSTGAAHEVWEAQGTALLAAFPDGTTRDAGCYIAGCVATIEFRTEAAYRRSVTAWKASKGAKAWTGGKQVTDPEVRSDGSVVVGVVLSRPD